MCNTAELCTITREGECESERDVSLYAHTCVLARHKRETSVFICSKTSRMKARECKIANLDENTRNCLSKFAFSVSQSSFCSAGILLAHF